MKIPLKCVVFIIPFQISDYTLESRQCGPCLFCRAQEHFCIVPHTHNKPSISPFGCCCCCCLWYQHIGGKYLMANIKNACAINSQNAEEEANNKERKQKHKTNAKKKRSKIWHWMAEWQGEGTYERQPAASKHKKKTYSGSEYRLPTMHYHFVSFIHRIILWYDAVLYTMYVAV